MSLLLALLLSIDAGEPVDAGRPAIVVQAGDVVPFSGVCMDDAKAVEVGKRLASAEAVAVAAIVKEPPPISIPALLTTAGTVLSAFASAFGVGYEVGQLKR